MQFSQKTQNGTRVPFGYNTVTSNKVAEQNKSVALLCFQEFKLRWLDKKAKHKQCGLNLIMTVGYS